LGKIFQKKEKSKTSQIYTIKFDFSSNSPLSFFWLKSDKNLPKKIWSFELFKTTYEFYEYTSLAFRAIPPILGI
jgi:hypothetical protein